MDIISYLVLLHTINNLMNLTNITLLYSLLVRQYDAIGELIRALEKTYVINAKTKLDVAEMWVGLSQIRALLPVQMSQEEEELMRKRLW